MARTLLQAVGAGIDKPLTERLNKFTQLDILEFAANGPLHKILHTLPGYRCCEFLRAIRPGFRDAFGTLCQDITTLTFARSSFDFIINQDILEHVKDPWDAFMEVSRVLKPGGKHIFTVSVHEYLGVSRQRAAKNSEGEHSFIHPPVYHPDPLNPSGCLVYWDFGQDLVQCLSQQGIVAYEGVSTRFYKPSETSNLSDPMQFRRYEFLKKRKSLSRAFYYNSITYISENIQQEHSAYKILYTTETDALQIVSSSYVHFLSGQHVDLTTVRSESVHWGGQTVQMVDLTLQCQDGSPAVILLVKVIWGDFSTFVFPDRFKKIPQVVTLLASQLHAFFQKMVTKQGDVPERFHMNIDGDSIEGIPVSERNRPGSNSYYTSVAHIRRYDFVARTNAPQVKKVLDIGCGFGYGLSMLDPKEGLGLDISEEAIQHASQAFPQKNIAWLNKDINNVDLNLKFDTITCFEVMEHLPDHIPLIDALVKYTHNTGTIFISIPNPIKHGKNKNHFHLRDYSLAALQALFARNFQEVEWFHQDDDCHDLQHRFLVKPGALLEHEFWIAKCTGAREKPAQMSTSIIMPLYNKWEYTRKAITALEANTPRSLAWELILIDNASTDETSDSLKNLPIKAIVHKNAENIGFAKACNQGALLGKGNYLVFLNNDTEVHPGWLEALLDELETHPETGIVGGRLHYPDGSIQHAGVVIGPDQIPYHIHRGKSADDPLVNERRPFPVITAACAAVRREEFLALGCFDEGFVNGHEDIDLCIRYRRQGQKCVYRPDCLVLHHESVSDGRMGSRPQNLSRTFKKSRYDLVQDDFAYRLRIDSIASNSQKMNFAIKIGVPQRGISGWGDIPFAECLAKEIVKAGHHCVIHYLSEWGNEDSDIDVVIHLKGLSEYYPKPWNYNIMWMLNHPDVHTKKELERYDAVFVASVPYADELRKGLTIPVMPLLQATDPDIFKPTPVGEDTYDIVFVGNNDGVGRLKMRKMIDLLLPTRYALAVFGRGWEGLLPPGVLKAKNIPWKDLPKIYSRATIVINDHQPMMAAHGFLNNRTFDILACGSIVVSDHVNMSSQILNIPQCRTRDCLNNTIETILENATQTREKVSALREEVLSKHTFSHRVGFIHSFLLRSKESSTVWDRIASARQRIATPSYRRQGPLVSVLMATYNRRNFLKNALNSVVSQTYENWELWLINDGGVTVDDIAHSFGDSRIHVVNLEDNRGKGHALNTGFTVSGGEYIAYHDDDDIWLPDHLERLMLAVRELPGIEFAYSDAALVTLRKNGYGHYVEQENELRYQRQVTLCDIMEFNHINGISALHKRDLFIRAGYFDESLKALIDFDMWKRLAALAYPYHISRITAEHYIRKEDGESQITSLAERNPLLYRKQRIRIMKKRLPLPEESPYHALQEEIFRKSIFEYFSCVCRESLKKKKTALSDTALRLAEKNMVFSVEGFRILALCYIDRKEYGMAVKTLEYFIDCPGTTMTDLFFAYHCALKMRSKPLSRKYALRIGEEQDTLGDTSRILYDEYNERFLSCYGEPVR